MIGLDKNLVSVYPHDETWSKEYEKLKRELSVKYANERKKYTALKNDFISSILEKAYKMYKL